MKDRPTTVAEAIEIIDELGRMTVVGNLPNATAQALWCAGAILADHARGKSPRPPLPLGMIERARVYATWAHASCNCYYGDKPYTAHLEMVLQAANDFSHLLPRELHPLAFAGAWVHDIIEDTNETFNDVAKILGEDVAEIAYLCANEKGRTREERANQAYYDGLKGHLIARYVKLCDRIANITHSKVSGSMMFNRYGKEYHHFAGQLYTSGFKAMFEHMETMIYGAPLARANLL